MRSASTSSVGSLVAQTRTDACFVRTRRRISALLCPWQRHPSEQILARSGGPHVLLGDRRVSRGRLADVRFPSCSTLPPLASGTPPTLQASWKNVSVSCYQMVHGGRKRLPRSRVQKRYNSIAMSPPRSLQMDRCLTEEEEEEDNVSKQACVAKSDCFFRLPLTAPSLLH